MIEVIRAKHWVNTRTGATASIYGACPYVSDADKADWEIQEYGWTWYHTVNGTVGLGRPAKKTRAEAQALADRFNKIHGYTK